MRRFAALATLAAALAWTACGTGGGDSDPGTPPTDEGAAETETPAIGDPGPDAFLCDDACPEEGARQCSGDGVRTCTADNDGCLAWGAAQLCDPGKKCRDGACVAACPDQPCTALGAHRCGEAGEVLECGDFDSDGCLQWGNAIPCSEGLVCSNGFCASDCTSECTVIGARKCDADSVVTCGDYDSDGCLTWGGATPCGEQVCSNGFCKTECEHECTQPGARTCDGNGFKTCDDHDGDGCLDWGTVLGCGQDQACSNGFCKDQCESECTVVGSKRCDLNSVQACDDYDQDGCLTWGSAVPCADGLKCSNGFCETTCNPECTVVGTKSCDEGGNVVTCGDWAKDGCLKWGSPTQCLDPLVCNDGNCAVDCSDDCTVQNEKKCVTGATNQFEVCGEWDQDGCLEWGSAQTCDGALVCSQGNCAQTCESECVVDGGKHCVDDATGTCGDYNEDGCLEWGTPVPCAPTEACDGDACAATPAPAKVVISEVLYDAVESPEVNLFVELWGPAGQDLAGFTLVGVNGNGGAVYATIALTGKIGADGRYVVAHPQSAAWIHDQADQLDPAVDLQNGPDSVQVRWGAAVVDALGYGSFSSAVFAGEGTPAAKSVAGHSLARDGSHTDTDDNAADFDDLAQPTPGAANVAVNEAPLASLSCPGTASLGDTVGLDGSASDDPDGSIAEFRFDFGDGTPAVSGAAAQVDHVFATTGTITVTLTVTDNGGLTDSATCTLNVGDTNAPTVEIVKPIPDPLQVTQGDVVNVEVNPTAAPGRNIATVVLVVDGVVTGAPDGSAPYAFAWTVPADAVTGSTIGLQARATDDQGSVGYSAVKHLAVRNDVPVPSFTAVVTGTRQVTVDASASRDTETPVADLLVRWDYENDGTWDSDWNTAKTAQHTYPADGKYTVKLEVKDAKGQTAQATRDVTLSSLKYVAGKITTTTWTGTIVITGDTWVPATDAECTGACALTIAEGTSVLFTPLDQDANGIGDYELKIQGRLTVNGTAANPVVFSVFGADKRVPRAWDRIILAGAGSTVSNAIVEYGDAGLDVRDDASISDTIVRSCQVGLAVNNPGKTATIARVVARDHAAEGLQVWGGTVNVSASSFQDCALRGVLVQGGTLNLSGSTVRDNDGAGIEYWKAGGGKVERNLVTGNAFEGIRIASDGATDPTPVINFNNLYGNALVKSRVVAALSGLSASGSGSGSPGGVTSATSWSTPAGEKVGAVRFEYSEYDYNGSQSGEIVGLPGGSSIHSVTDAATRWAFVESAGATGVKARTYDGYSSYSGTMTLTHAAYETASAARQVSIVTLSNTVDLKHNYLGAFPKVLDAVTLSHPGAANLQGFVGVPFDGTWAKGPYVGGETLAEDTTWSGTIYVTGVLETGGKALTLVEGTRVQFVPVDQEGDGIGDYQINSRGSVFTCSGTAANPVVFTVHGTPAKNGWKEVGVHGANGANLAYTVFEYGVTGLHLTGGTHVLSHVTVQDNGQDGLRLGSATGSTTVGDLVAQRNSRSGLMIEQYKGLVVDRATLTENGLDGVTAIQVQDGATVDNSTLTKNGRAGAWVEYSGAGAGSSTLTLDHCTIDQNTVGVEWRGNAFGTLTYSNVRYNRNEGIRLVSSPGGGHPNPRINNCNVYGNAVVAGGVLSPVALTAAGSGSGSPGQVSSSPWSTPGAQEIVFLRLSYSEYDYNGSQSGGVRKDSSAGFDLYTTTESVGSRFVDVSGGKAKTIVAYTYDGYSSYSGTMTVDSAYYLVSNDPTVVKASELVALTELNQVDAQFNYWGAFPDPMPRFTLARTDAIKIDGYVGEAHDNLGPQ